MPYPRYVRQAYPSQIITLPRHAARPYIGNQALRSAIEYATTYARNPDPTNGCDVLARRRIQRLLPGCVSTGSASIFEAVLRWARDQEAGCHFYANESHRNGRILVHRATCRRRRDTTSSLWQWAWGRSVAEVESYILARLSIYAPCSYCFGRGWASRMVLRIS